ncbi:ubiquitin hydrolase [Trypanosoma conorhini]|uniref:Ubiquitin hydrolase n=1 Tax=Trypanosoma conorhini TaxID=83891 RepID=A0A422PL02_9TRYP|nr:ubiquitin hydrolase [Trypanosoma conorhini]RNF18376.1 ubiquitin hydrolase [Trypanosoma conorhini]
MQDSDIAGVPFYLILQLNRFHYHRETGNYEKVMDKVTINKDINVPVRVVMREGSCADGAEPTGEEAVAYRQIQYRLVAVVVHSGPSPRSGHYFTLLRSFADDAAAAVAAAEEDEDEDAWVLANDSMIAPLTSATAAGVLSGSNGVFGPSETPYIILYERCGNPPPASDALELPDAVVLPGKVEQLLRGLVLPAPHAPPTAHSQSGNGNDGGGGGGGGDDPDGDGAAGRRGSSADAVGLNNSFWGGGSPIF